MNTKEKSKLINKKDQKLIINLNAFLQININKIS